MQTANNRASGGSRHLGDTQSRRSGNQLQREGVKKRQQVTWNHKSGGEGGIRTPDTGVSPYNGLANLSISLAHSRIKSLRMDWQDLKWVNGISFGNYCSPLCSPLFPTKQGGLGSEWRLTNINHYDRIGPS